MTDMPQPHALEELSSSVAVRQSFLYETNTGIVRQGHDVLLVDPGIFAIELDALASDLANDRIVAGFTTHPHWDHILWAPSLGGDVPRYASVATVDLLGERRERLLGQLAEVEADESVGSQQWDRDVLFTERPLPHGFNVIEGFAVELVAVDGHCAGQTALVFLEHGVAFVADTLSDVETISPEDLPGSWERSIASMDRLQAIVDRVDLIVPGHGSPANRSEAQRRLDADRRYLDRVPRMVGDASADIPDEELARRILTELDETRVESGLGWEIHLETVQALRSPSQTGEV